MNVTRTSPSNPFPVDGIPSDLSHGSLVSSNTLPSSSSLSSETPDVATLLQTSEATPEIERWRSSVSTRAMDDTRGRSGESIDRPASEASSRATSHMSSRTDIYSATPHSAYTPGQGVYAMHSDSSLSLASHTLSSPHPNRKTRELPPLPPTQGYSYTGGPPSASSRVSHASYLTRRRVSQDEPPPLPPLPGSSHTFPHDRRPSMSPVSVPSRRATTSPTSSIHSRSLPVPPTPSSAKPPVPPLPIMPSLSRPPSPELGPASSTSPDPPLPRSRSFTHLRSISSFPESQHNYDSPVKLPPNYSAGAHDPFPLPAPASTTGHRAGVGRSLSIRTTNISHGLSARSASIRVTSSRSGLGSGDGDPFDLPPAYSAVDMARSPLQLRGVSGDAGTGEGE